MRKHRFKDNPKEEEFYNKFTERIEIKALSHIIFGSKTFNYFEPDQLLTEREYVLCRRTIQWLGSPVGRGFLRDCGYVEKEKC